MAQSDARFGYKAKNGREGFRMGRGNLFTCTTGMLLPIFNDFASPGDAYYIQHDLDYLRTAPLLAPAMVDVKVHFESFFVPIQMIYQPFEQAFFSLKDLQSSFYTPANQLNNALPTWDYTGFVTYMVSSLQNSALHADAFRLADLLDLNPFVFAQNPNTTPQQAPINDYQPSFFPWQLAAYHCIWNYFYRLDDKSEFQNSYFNLDKFYSSTVDFDFTGLSNPWLFMQIHQRAWDFDYFSSLYRSPIISDANVQDLIAFTPDLFGGSTQTVQPVSDQGLPVSNGANGGNSAMRATVGNFGSTYDRNALRTSTSTAYIRQMFADEKLSMITGRTRKTYDAQVLAHFGVKVPHDVKHDISLIGADTYELRVGEVTSLADSGNSGLADLAGKGWAQGSGKSHKFVAPCHGVIMTIFSIEPKKSYYNGFAKWNAIQNIFNFPVPEFDRLGNVPMFRYEIGGKLTGSMTNTDNIGWKERYYEWKRRYDKTSLAFMAPYNVGDYNNFNAYSIASTPFTWAMPYAIGQNQTGRPDLEDRFYIDRYSMNSLVAAPFQNVWYDGEGIYSDENWNDKPWLAYGRDPFIVNSALKVKKVSWMSKDGEPVYVY